jgi:hypothetical protein
LHGTTIVSTQRTPFHGKPVLIDTIGKNCSRAWNSFPVVRSEFEKSSLRLRMEILVGFYMRPRLSPWLGLKRGAKRLKMGLFSFFRLVFGFLIFAL